MPTKTLLQLRTEVLQRANLENSDNFATSAEVNGLINDSVKAWRDLIIENRGQDFFTADTNFPLTGATGYVLPSDFYQALSIFYQDGDTLLPLQPFSLVDLPRLSNIQGNVPVAYRLLNTEITFLPFTASGYTVQVSYVPFFTDLALDADTLEVYNGWSEWIVLDAAMKLLEKESTDTSQLAARLQRTEERLLSQIQSRDRSFPETVVDVEPVWRRGWY